MHKVEDGLEFTPFPGDELMVLRSDERIHGVLDQRLPGLSYGPPIVLEEI